MLGRAETHIAMSQTESVQTCPDCGAPLPSESPQALCPACLLRQALASHTLAGRDETPSPTPPTPEEIADQFPQFEITECLGRGGMGVVYKARQKSLDRWVAIKVLAPERSGEEKFAERFAREAATLAKLNHPNIVTVHDFGETGAIFYIVMEYVNGVNLRDLLRDGKMDPKQALAIVPPICDALQYAHDKGIVHRDIKPENLLLDREGRVKIADFGIAALVGAGGESAGTPPYMAPEQDEPRSEVDHRADIYALGVVLYEMLTGERPGKQIEAPSKKVQIDVRLDEIVLRALERKPELRYQQASDVKTMVETIVTTPLPQNTSAPVAPGCMSTTGSPSKVSLCYITTPEHLRSLWGRLIYIYKGKGELRLDAETLSFHSTWPTVTIPLASIQKLAMGDYPVSAKPVPLHYLSVTFTEGSASRTLLFTPVWTAVMNPWEANQIAEEWLSVLRDAIQARTGRMLPVDKSEEVQNVSWWDLTKAYLAMTAVFTVLFSVIPLMIHHRLPDRWSELWNGPIFATVLMAISLLERWLRGRSDPAKKIPPFSRMAILSACWAAFSCVEAAQMLMAKLLPPSVLMASPVWWTLHFFRQTGLGFTGFLGATILGWVSVAQIRRSAGGLRGLWLGVFDGLLFPILLLNGVFAWVVSGLARIFVEFNSNFSNLNNPQVHPSLITRFANLLSQHSGLTVFVIVALLITADFFIIRAVWRTVTKPVSSTPVAGTPARSWRWIAVIVVPVIVLASLALTIAVSLSEWTSKSGNSASTGVSLLPPQAKDQLREQLTQEGWQLWQARKLVEAEAKFQKAVQLAPGDANAWNGLGWAQFNAGNSKSAEQAFLKSVGIEPTQPGALNGLGQIYLSQRKYDDAEKFLLKAAPQASAAWFGLARLYLLEGKYPQAEAWAQKIGDSGQADEVAKKMLEAAKAKNLSDALRLRIEPAPANKASQAQSANSAVPGDTWSPTLAPGEKPNFQNIRTEADTLMNQGRFDESLQRHIWYFNHALALGESNPVRLSFGLMGWGELARRYPPARQALIEVRNRDAQTFFNGGGYFDLFMEVTSINGVLREDDATLALFNSVRQKNAAVAKQCYFAAETLLVSKGEYGLCLSYLGDPMVKIKNLLEQWNMGKDGNSRDAYAVSFVGGTCRLIEILVGTGHKAEAETIRSKAVAALDDARLKLAVSDAEERVRQRSPKGKKEKTSGGTPLPP